MIIKQLSVFVENKPGRLTEITRTLNESAIDIRALSIADTKDFGILRLIVNRPCQAEEVLKGAGFTVSLTEVIAIGIKDEPGGLAEAMHVLYENQVSVEYMYAFISRTNGMAFVILRVDDNKRSIEILQKNGIHILQNQDIYNM